MWNACYRYRSVIGTTPTTRVILESICIISHDTVHPMNAREVLSFPPESRAGIDPYLPQNIGPARAANGSASANRRPFVTLTYAVSLDSQIAAAPGTQTILSGPASKAMTHYLRTRHDAIAVGSGTAIADDPTLNSRLDAASGNTEAQPRPIILDRTARWALHRDSKVVQAAETGRGKAPWIMTGSNAKDSVPLPRSQLLDAIGGAYVFCESTTFPDVLAVIAARGITSIMIEGGGVIINDILSRYLHLVDSIIVTIAPVYLGAGGVVVCPPKIDESPAAAAFTDVFWTTLGADTVMCARPRRQSG